MKEYGERPMADHITNWADTYMDEARHRIAEAARTRANVLDLGGLRLTRLPEELYAEKSPYVLHRITKLYLGGAKSIRNDPYQGFTVHSRDRRNYIVDISPKLFLALPNLTYLDLKHNKLTALPSEIASLTSLTHLDLGDNKIGSQGGQALAPLTSLRFLDLCYNHIGDEGVRSLAAMTELTSLNLWFNSLTDDGAEVLQVFTKLKYLNLRANSIADRGAQSLAKLTNLTYLDLVGNSVGDRGAQAIGALTKLTKLELGGNKVGNQGAKALGALTRLARLDLSRNKVGDKGAQALAPLNKLTQLYLSDNNRIGDDGAIALAKLTRLTSLGLSGNKIGQEGARALTKLTNLVYLTLMGNSFGDTPFDLSPFMQLTRLKYLELSHLRAHSSLSPIWDLPALESLTLWECILPGVPEELMQGEGDDTLKSLRAHFEDLKSGAAEITDVKFMILGNGRTGKTQICRRLCDEDYDETISSTHGVHINVASFALSAKEIVTFKILDFGGQDIYHGTHALFLKSRAIFLIVWAPDAEAVEFHQYKEFTFRNQPLGYWLDYVSECAGPQTPVIIIQAQCDKPEQEVPRLPISDKALDSFTYKKLLHYSAKMDRGRAALNEALAEAARWLRAQRGIDKIGKGRAQVKAELESMRDAGIQILSLDDYFTLCKTIGGISSEKLLLDYLHDIGTVFYRDRLFSDNIILDQAWALNAMYAVLDRDSKVFNFIRAEKGRFRRSDLAALVWQDYGEEEQDVFLHFMQQCGICFSIRKGDVEHGIEPIYVAPDLLPDRSDAEVQRALKERWDAGGDVLAEYRLTYKLLPPGLMRTALAKIGEQAGLAGEYWLDGFYVYDFQTDSRALVEQRRTRGWTGEIVVQTKGGNAATLLNAVLRCIDDRHAMVGARPGKRGQKIYESHPDTSATLIRPNYEPSRPPEYAVSYAWGDASNEGRKREELVDSLCMTAEVRGITIVRDKIAMGYGERISKFMERIGRGDRIFIFLSDKYLRSAFCMQELFDIWRNCHDQETEFISRTRVYMLPCAKIQTFKERAAYVRYWRERLAEMEEVVASNGIGVLAKADLTDYRNMRDFVSNTPDMLRLVLDVFSPRNFDEFVEYGLN